MDSSAQIRNYMTRQNNPPCGAPPQVAFHETVKFEDFPRRVFPEPFEADAGELSRPRIELQ